jgi:hypothetical protein
MKKMFSLLLFQFFSIACFAGKEKSGVEIVNDTVFLNTEKIFILEKISIGFGQVNYYVKNTSGQKLAFIKLITYTDPSYITSSNPKGNASYFEITFLKSGQKAEFLPIVKESKLAMFLISQNLFVNGTITEESEKEFILLNGNEFSRERNELNHGNTIIIQENNTTPTNGLNIKIGR